MYVHKVSHFKSLINVKLDLEVLGCSSTFTLCHSLLKKAILHYTMAKDTTFIFRNCKCFYPNCEVHGNGYLQNTPFGKFKFQYESFRSEHRDLCWFISYFDLLLRKWGLSCLQNLLKNFNRTWLYHATFIHTCIRPNFTLR